MSLQTSTSICPETGKNRMWRRRGWGGRCRQLLVVLGEPRNMLGRTTSESLEKSLVSTPSLLDNIRVFQIIQARPNGGNIVQWAKLSLPFLCPSPNSCLSSFWSASYTHTHPAQTHIHTCTNENSLGSSPLSCQNLFLGNDLITGQMLIYLYYNGNKCHQIKGWNSHWEN